MNKSEILIISLMILLGVLLLAGEWLCVNVFWHCLDYRPVVTSLSLVLIVFGSILLAAVLEDKDNH